MMPKEIADFLDKSLQDRQFSRGERQAMQQFAEGGDEQQLAACRKLAFEKAAAALGTPDAAAVLEWLEGVCKALQPKTVIALPAVEVHFSPGEACCRRIQSLLGAAKRTLDICVFTITDDRITQTILAAHRRKVRVRLVTDNDKAGDLGSDIEELRRGGVPVRMDDSPYHMHHKFVIVDGETLLNGSFNWTRSASMNNQENFIVSDDARLVDAFQKEFDRLWAGFQGNQS
jgi:mitochondrial cardiolipin hydrolase